MLKKHSLTTPTEACQPFSQYPPSVVYFISVCGRSENKFLEGHKACHISAVLGTHVHLAIGAAQLQLHQICQLIAATEHS